MSVPRVLVISGSMGAGKTTVMGEASDLLSDRGIVHAAFDLDALGVVLLPELRSRELHYRNLNTIFNNCTEAGVEFFLVAAAVESRAVLSDLTRSMGNATVTVCRLIASLDTMAERLRTREVGSRRQQYLNRSRVLEAILDAGAVKDFREFQTTGRASLRSLKRCFSERLDYRSRIIKLLAMRASARCLQRGN
jgi:ribose 1,5-bisphosphokinase PhnN